MTHIHLIGISGSGLSAIARILLESGYTVSGSDRAPNALGQELASLGAVVHTGHAAENIAGADLVVRSSAIPDSNPEVQAACAAGIPVLKRSAFLGRLLEGKTTVAVAGTHGKTTTSAMLAWALTRLEADPSYIIGGVSNNLHCNAHAGQGSQFVIEADEYDRMFLGLTPSVAIVTMLEHDHPDCYPTMDDYTQAFVAFLNQVQSGGITLLNQDNPACADLRFEIPAGRAVFTYGLTDTANYHAVNISRNSSGCLDADVTFNQAHLAHLSMQVPGEHNICNACAALAALHNLGFDPQLAADALSEFSGTGRRFDIRAIIGGITVIDDYAHHPTEIRTTLAAARERFPGQRIWAVWQPHTYSRTQTLLPQFAASFTDADQVIVTEVFASREQNPGFSSARVVEKMDHAAVRFIETLTDTASYLIKQLEPGDVVLVLSAGDADQVSAAVVAALKAKENRHE